MENFENEVMNNDGEVIATPEETTADVAEVAPATEPGLTTGEKVATGAILGLAAFGAVDGTIKVVKWTKKTAIPWIKKKLKKEEKKEAPKPEEPKAEENKPAEAPAEK